MSDNEECLTLTHSDDGGAFQLSSGEKESGVVTESEIDCCIKQLNGEWSAPQSNSYGSFTGLTVFSIQEGIYWQWWFLAAGPIVLRVTYNAAPEYKTIELPQVKMMLNSLRLENT